MNSLSPYRDPNLSVEHRTDDLLARMTTEEKAGLLFHTAVTIGANGQPSAKADPDNSEMATSTLVVDRLINHLHIWNGDEAEHVANWHNAVQEMAESTRLGIPISVATDPRHGVRSTPFTGLASQAVSRWPEHTGIAAIGDPGLARRYGDVVRRELVAMGIRVYLGPMADLFTDPRWSRGYGTFGEDVELASALTAAFIEGLRGGPSLGPHSVAAMVKHFPGGGPQKDGRDAHDFRYREQVYPGGLQELHLKPFEAALKAGVTQVMPYYGMPIGTAWPEVGFAFNGPVIQGLLRERYSFEGIVCGDWFLLEPAKVGGHDFGPNGYGLEHLTPAQRLKAALDAGVDQFGGDHCTHLVVELVESGQVSERRIDRSARRLLREKFRLGLFEQRRVDPTAASVVVGSIQNRQEGYAAQQASLVLLSNESGLEDRPTLPLAPGLSVYAEGVGPAFDTAIAPFGTRVESSKEADVNLVRLDCPWDINDSPVGEAFHDGTLEFPEDVVDRIADLTRDAPTIVAVYLERPAVLTPFVGVVSALVGDFGAADGVLAQTLFGVHPFTGTLPFDLPSSDTAVQESREDVPFDTSGPLFKHGHGLKTLPTSPSWR